MPIRAFVPATRRGGRDVCPYCNRLADRKKDICPHCGKKPLLHEARWALLILSGLCLMASVALEPLRGILFGLSALFLSGGLYLFSKPQQKLSDNRLVFLPLALLVFGLIPVATGSMAGLALALVGTVFSYFAIPSLHSPGSEDLSKCIEEFEAQNQLAYGFGNIRDQIRATIAASEGVKQAVLSRDLLPRIDRLLDQKLLSILKRKVSLERILATTDPARLEEERKKTLERASLIKSDAVRTELARSATLASSMLDNYARIAELLNIYNVQIRNLQKVLLNLNMKIAATAFDDGGLDSIRMPLDAIDQEMEIMERSFREIDVTLIA